jgi:hypothetical protein
MVVKYGLGVETFEATAAAYIAEHTSIPVPNMYACYRYGPIDRDVGDYGTLYDTYLFMGYIEGESLDKLWDTFDS